MVFNKKKKILFLVNGGTVSQIKKEISPGKTTLVPPENSAEFEKSCKKVFRKFSTQFSIDVDLVTTKDSTNLIPEDWSLLIDRIKKAQNEEGYDAVLITNGTDTMSYVAAALCFGLHGSNPNGSNLKIPVCITGSQRSIYEEDTDAVNNLSIAFETLKLCLEDEIADVLVNFDQEVFLACRVTKISERKLKAFGSPNFPPVGIVKNEKLMLDTKVLNAQKNYLPSSMDFNHFARGVVSFDLTPGTDPSVISAILHTGNVQAMMFRCFGEGNVCFEGDFNLIPVIEEATSKNIPIFLTSKIMGGRASADGYEVGVRAVEAGAIPCYDQTDTVVAVKSSWLLGNGLCTKIEDFRKAMKTNYLGEVTL